MKTTLGLGIMFLALASGCAATQLRPGAESVLVSRQVAPKSCRYVGTVIGEQGGSFAGPLTSNKNLAQGSMNDMKNQAQGLGANYVVLENTSTGNTISGNGHSMNGGQTDVTHTGNAYVCPPEEVGMN